MSYKQILLIEDDEADQRIFSTVLQSMGRDFFCTIVDDAGEALDKLENGDITPDLIFLDMRMPGMTGLEFLTALRHNDALREIPAIVLAGLLNEDDRRETKSLGALDYIIKPTRYSELRTILSSILVS
jgi:CheY-like chemotaxis protein